MVDEEKEFYRKCRGNLMEIVGVTLRMYKKTKDPKWLEHAKWFGEKSAELKTKI
jgi:inorganic pyrophosphatase